MTLYPYVPAGDESTVNGEEHLEANAAGLVLYLIDQQTVCLLNQLPFPEIQRRVTNGRIIRDHSVDAFLVNRFSCDKPLHIALDYLYKAGMVEGIQ